MQRWDKVNRALSSAGHLYVYVTSRWNILSLELNDYLYMQLLDELNCVYYMQGISVETDQPCLASPM